MEGAKSEADRQLPIADEIFLDHVGHFVRDPEAATRALVRAFNRWDPHLWIDTHTTNGSHHRYTLTYEGPKNPAGDRRLIGFAFERYHENRASGCTATLDDAARQRAVSGEDAERAVSRHSGLWAGRSRVSNRRG